MKKTKSVFAITLALSLSLSLAACNSDDGEELITSRTVTQTAAANEQPSETAAARAATAAPQTTAPETTTTTATTTTEPPKPDLSELPESPASDFTFQKYTYLDEVAMRKYTGSDTFVRIPAFVGPYPVTGITSKAFEDKIKGVYIPDSVTRIDDIAFNRTSKAEIFYNGQTYDGFAELYYSLKGFEVMRFSGYDWLVLEKKDDLALILSVYVLERRTYHSESDITDQLRGYSTTWEESGIRRYLNDEFYNSFSDANKARIVETEVINNDNPTFGTPGGNNTTDKIFLLSIEEANYYFSDNDSRVAYFNGANTDFNDKAWWWWLRSPGRYAYYAVLVPTSGGGLRGVQGFGEHVGDRVNVGVRPAMWITLE
jgi:uncharacterized lipoprotein YehR (DUF1307 family)